ncbi:MAG: hypothetical protein JWQ21_816 [Herminiimonas sp.]|nr:hypothetical protein [Herminiimonas sp.]
MDIIGIINALEQNGFTRRSNAPLATGYGEKFVLLNGGIVTVYTTGRWQIQGKLLPEAREKLAALMGQLLP